VPRLGRTPLRLLADASLRSELARAAQAAMRARHSTEDEAAQYTRLLLAIGRRPVS
jgi:hypothetical protein